MKRSCRDNAASQDLFSEGFAGEINADADGCGQAKHHRTFASPDCSPPYALRRSGRCATLFANASVTYICLHRYVLTYARTHHGRFAPGAASSRQAQGGGGGPHADLADRGRAVEGGGGQAKGGKAQAGRAPGQLSDGRADAWV